MPFDVDGYLVPGEDFVLGDTHVEIYATPGHTIGCASFIFDVYDCGKKHRCMLWGGTGPNRIPELLEKEIASAEYFDGVCREKGVDCEVSNHPFTDNLVERLNVLNHIVDGVQHPLVIGTDGVHKMMMMYKQMYIDALAEKRARV